VGDVVCVPPEVCSADGVGSWTVRSTGFVQAVNASTRAAVIGQLRPLCALTRVGRHDTGKSWGWQRTHNGRMDRAAVEQWVALYERLWRTPGVDRLAELFSPEAVYRPSPWAEPLEGLAAIAGFWDAERDSSGEEFTLSSDVVAVDGETAVVRVSVRYGDPATSRWRDLWVVRLAPDGRCSSYEEWPFAPGQPDGHSLAALAT